MEQKEVKYGSLLNSLLTLACHHGGREGPPEKQLELIELLVPLVDRPIPAEKRLVHEVAEKLEEKFSRFLFCDWVQSYVGIRAQQLHTILLEEWNNIPVDDGVALLLENELNDNKFFMQCVKTNDALTERMTRLFMDLSPEMEDSRDLFLLLCLVRLFRGGSPHNKILLILVARLLQRLPVVEAAVVIPPVPPEPEPEIMEITDETKPPVLHFSLNANSQFQSMALGRLPLKEEELRLEMPVDVRTRSRAPIIVCGHIQRLHRNEVDVKNCLNDEVHTFKLTDIYIKACSHTAYRVASRYSTKK
jgi:hypothetical protein